MPELILSLLQSPPEQDQDILEDYWVGQIQSNAQDDLDSIKTEQVATITSFLRTQTLR